AATRVRQERRPLDQARVPGAGRHLHAFGLLAEIPAGSSGAGHRAELAGWLLLPVPRLQVRSRRPRAHRLAGAEESPGAAVPLRRRQDADHRRRPGEGVMAIVPNPHKTTGFLGWIDDRFPLTKIWKDHISEYYAPKNF